MITHNDKEIIHQRIIRLIQINGCFFLLLFLRSWYIVIVDGEAYQKEALAPQQHKEVIPAVRGEIYDRFAQPLAVNQIQYTLAIDYSQIKEKFPSVKRGKNKEGNTYPRKEYLERLTRFLAEELERDYYDISDQLHSRAVFHLPGQYYILAENIQPELFYRLKGRTHLWPGIRLQSQLQRHYPQNKVGGSVIGYVGYLDSQRYVSINQEIQQLKEFLQMTQEELLITPYPEGCSSMEEVEERLKNLTKQSYSLYDRTTGKAGLELYYDRQMRGQYGIQRSRIDAKGRALEGDSRLKEEENEKIFSGYTLQLTLSAELQETCEQLLAENEQIREGRSRFIDPSTGLAVALKQPWIKGGAIVAMRPDGEILALATYPRYDANDLLPTHSYEADQRKNKQKQINLWLENETYLKEVWQMERPLQREIFEEKKGWFTEEKELNWDNYLHFILKEESRIKFFLGKYNKISQVLTLVNFIHSYLDSSSTNKGGGTQALIAAKEGYSKIKGRTSLLEEFFSLDLYEQILLLDLSKILITPEWREAWNKNNMMKIDEITLAQWKVVNAAMVQLEQELEKILSAYYRGTIFAQWRQDNEKMFLQKKRKEEKEERKNALKTQTSKIKNSPKERLYTYYIEEEFQRQYSAFKESTLPLARSYLQTVFRKKGTVAIDKNLSTQLNLSLENILGRFSEASCRSFYSVVNKIEWEKFPYELLVSYHSLQEPLLGHYPFLRQKEQEEAGEKKKKKIATLQSLANAFVPSSGFGQMRSHAYRQSTPQGSIFKLVPAYAALMTRYDQIVAQGGVPSYDELNQFLVFYDERHRKPGSKVFYPGYTSDGKLLGRIYKGGRIPNSSHGGIGKVNMVQAIATSSNPYFALLSGDYMDANFLNQCAYAFSYGHRTGVDLPEEFAGSLPKDIPQNRSGLYAYSIGQHSLTCTPLQTAVMLAGILNHGKIPKPYLLNSTVDTTIGLSAHKTTPEYHEVRLPPVVRNLLLEGMSQAVNNPKGTARPSVILNYSHRPSVMQDYMSMRDDFIAKTGTAEIFDMVALDEGGQGVSKVQIYNHIWAAGATFTRESRGLEISQRTPELIVVVYLRYGDFGKDALPLASQVIKKWRQLN